MMNIIDIIAIIPYFITLATVVAEGKEQDWYQRCVLDSKVEKPS